jgi:hypothetical protein
MRAARETKSLPFASVPLHQHSFLWLACTTASPAMVKINWNYVSSESNWWFDWCSSSWHGERAGVVLVPWAFVRTFNRISSSADAAGDWVTWKLPAVVLMSFSAIMSNFCYVKPAKQFPSSLCPTRSPVVESYPSKVSAILFHKGVHSKLDQYQ